MHNPMEPKDWIWLVVLLLVIATLFVATFQL